jgi:hypothetical protein
VVTGEGDVVHLAYTGNDGADGTAWYRRIEPDGTLTPREQLAAGLGTEETDASSILPLVYIPETNTVVVIYRLATGRLLARRIVGNGAPGEPMQVSDRNVVQSAIDSDQTGADAIAHGETVHVLFIEDETGSIYHASSDARGSWNAPELVQDGITAQWIRGTLHSRRSEGPAYGFVYDAGSDGGSGMNRFGVVPLAGR